jgi:hypothetical protein
MTWPIGEHQKRSWEMLTSKAALAAEGVEVMMNYDDGEIIATVRTQVRKQREDAFQGRPAEALQRARELSLQSGLGGYYGISGPEERRGITVEMLEEGVLAEIERQIADLRPKSGVRSGFNLPRWSTEELGEMPAAQKQISSLMGLRDRLTKRLPR